MNYPPNEEGAVWLARVVWPEVRRQQPDARLLLVGSCPPRRVRGLADPSLGIVVTGFVPEVTPYLWAAAVSAAPLFTARGVQTKVLEAVAAGLPVVLRFPVAGGLPPEILPACTVADKPEAFARALVECLRLQPDERRALAASADLSGMGWEARLTPFRAILKAKPPAGHAALDPSSIPHARDGATALAQPGPPVVVSDADNPAVWDEFVLKHREGTVEHLFGVERHLPACLWTPSVYWIARRGSEPVGVLPLVLVRSLLIGRTAVSLPFTSYGGVLALEPAASDALVRQAAEVARAFGASRVELRNLARQVPGASCTEHKVGVRLPLPDKSENLWAGLDRKVRNQVRKAQKEGLVTDKGGPELLDHFYTVFAENMRDLVRRSSRGACSPKHFPRSNTPLCSSCAKTEPLSPPASPLGGGIGRSCRGHLR